MPGGMLIVLRRSGQGVFIGRGVKVTMLGLEGDQVRLGIEAPLDLQVSRDDFGFETHLGKQIRREQERRGEPPTGGNHAPAES